MSVKQSVVLADTRECQDRVGVDVPSARDVWVVQQLKVVSCCPGTQALTVRRYCTVTTVAVLTVDVASVQTGGWERRDGRVCESREWRFVDVNDLISFDVYLQPLSLWLLWRWSTSVHSNRSWTNVARPCSCSGLTQLSEKLGITSLSVVVQWVSWRTMTSALFLWASSGVGNLINITDRMICALPLASRKIN